MPLPLALYLLAAAIVLMAGGLPWLAVGALALGTAFEIAAFFVGGMDEPLTRAELEETDAS